MFPAGDANRLPLDVPGLSNKLKLILVVSYHFM